MPSVLLSTAYLPPVEYFAAVARYGQVWIEACETYQKQSYRNRCTILTANGKMNLNIPVKRGGDSFSHNLPISEIEIDYSENWPVRHFRAMEAAYMSSPFFVYYKDEIKDILYGGEKLLFNFNLSLIKLLARFCGIKAEFHLTGEYLPATQSKGSISVISDPGSLLADIPSGCQEGDIIDLRYRIHPKSKEPSLMKEWGKEKPYWQVFSAKQGFVSGLSIVDLLFNEGPNSISFLQ
ncbi:MAG: WbqC family protein [Bacteroidales bacterium]|nr:WbqC family protein [Bacteroidales bacterium]